MSALEHFLEAIPDDVRPGVQTAVVLHFSRTVSMADLRDFLNAVGSDDAASAVDRAIATQPSREKRGSRDAPTPSKHESFTMEPPASPRLRALWDAIEPRQ